MALPSPRQRKRYRNLFGELQELGVTLVEKSELELGWPNVIRCAVCSGLLPRPPWLCPAGADLAPTRLPISFVRRQTGVDWTAERVYYDKSYEADILLLVRRAAASGRRSSCLLFSSFLDLQPLHGKLDMFPLPFQMDGKEFGAMTEHRGRAASEYFTRLREAFPSPYKVEGPLTNLFSSSSSSSSSSIRASPRARLPPR